MASKIIVRCEYCGVSQTVDEVYLCLRCGAPLKPAEKQTITNRVLSIFDNVMDYDWSPGIDVSKWQGDMTWSTAKPLIDYSIVKASENVWEDEKYARNVDACHVLEIPTGVYHYCRPEYNYKAQAQFFAERVVGDLPAFADLERTGGLSRTGLESWIYSFVNEVQQLSGYTVGIYTRSIFWNDYVARNSWAHEHPLWVARYNSYITDPGIPLDWDNWVLWQWSADGNGEGSIYGAESASIDKNRFNGTTEDFYRWIGKEIPISPAFQYRVLVDTLNVRSGPDTTYPIVDSVHRDGIVEQVDVSGDDVWIEIEPGKFCAHTYNGHRYLDKV